MKGIRTILACAALGVGSLAASPAQAGDWSLDVRVVAGEPHGRVWVEPVYEVRVERVYVEPVYEDRCERVWVAPIIENRTERVWVPDRFETRSIRCVDQYGRVFYRTETVLVERGHYTDVCRQVVIREGRWEEVRQRVLVREGGWTTVEKRVCVREGYWTWAPRPSHRELDVRVNRGDVYAQPVRRYDDADRYREARERDRNQQRHDDRDRRDDRSRDRGDRYR